MTNINYNREFKNVSIVEQKQLFLMPLRNWLYSIEQVNKPLEKLKDRIASKLCMSKNPIAVMNVWETLIEAQNNSNFVKFMDVMGVPENDVKGKNKNNYGYHGEITGWSIYKHKRDGIKNVKGSIIVPGLNLKSRPTKRTVSSDEYYERKIYVPNTTTLENDRIKETLGKKNPYYSFKISKSTVARTLRKLEAMDLEFVYSIVLTYPREISKMYLELPRPHEVDLRLRKCIKKFSKELSELLGGKIAFCCNNHVWSSMNPLNPHAHAHLLLLDRVITAEKEKQIIPNYFMDYNERTKRYEESNNTRILKGLWTHIVKKEFKELELPYGVDNTLNVNVDFVELKTKEGLENLRGHKRLIHKLKYNRRRPLADLALFYMFNEFELNAVDNEYADHLINYENRTYCLGYWNRMSKYVKREIDETPLEKEIRCQVCGEPLVYDGFWPHKQLPKNVLRVFLDRKSIVWLVRERG